jgi:hypothetical protein
MVSRWQLLVAAIAAALPAPTPGSVFLCAVNGACPQGRANVGSVIGCREYVDGGGCQQVSADFFLGQARTVTAFVSLFTSPAPLNRPVSHAHRWPRSSLFSGNRTEQMIHLQEL